MPHPLPPDPSVGYLLAAVQRRKGLAIRALLAPYGVTPTQYAVLARLVEEDGLTLQDVSERLFADTTATCRTLGRLEAAGLIERRPDPDDRRRVRQHLTNRGRELIGELRPLVRAWDRRLLRALDDAQLEALKTTLRHVLDELDRIEEAP